jgi:hypothetical protein
MSRGVLEDVSLVPPLTHQASRDVVCTPFYNRILQRLAHNTTAVIISGAVDEKGIQ